MPSLAAQQIDSIHAMLASGQRSLRLERHSLVLWGVCFGGLIALSNHIITAQQIPDPTQRALAWLGLMSVVLGTVSLLDWALTRRAKRARDEFWSFIHRQVLKVWWLLLAAGVLATFATFFYGGGYLVYPLWLVLVGLGLYVHGLFSEQAVEWAGGLLIAFGVCAALFRLDVNALQCLAASAFGLGLPLLAALLERGEVRPVWLRAANLLLWLAVVLGAPLLAQHLADASQPAPAPLRSLEQWERAPLQRQAVLLPAGLTVPVRFDVSGDLFAPSAASVLPLMLRRPVEVLAEDGHLTGAWRYPDGRWHGEPLPAAILVSDLRAELQPNAGAQVHARLHVSMTARDAP
ncbi:MAG: MFS transporter permease [Pseudomonadota bacterium]